jgi:[histone H3]-lysine4 N-trimethyltransferase ATXR3
VSTWIQCEQCQKWRRVPWHVDRDTLPEKFVCSDNKWNPSAQSCDSPEDDWDAADALVGDDGKVEGTPIKKQEDEKLNVLEEKSFLIGGKCGFERCRLRLIRLILSARFDVLRSGKKQHSLATVTKVDFSGSVKRIMFHFAKTSAAADEWVPFGSNRIAPLHSKVPKTKKALIKESSAEVNASQTATKEISVVVDPQASSSFSIGGKEPDITDHACF